MTVCDLKRDIVSISVNLSYWSIFVNHCSMLQFTERRGRKDSYNINSWPFICSRIMAYCPPPSLNWIQSSRCGRGYFTDCWAPLWWSLIIWPVCCEDYFLNPSKSASTPRAVSQANPSRALRTIQFAPFVFRAFLYPKVIEALILFKATHVM